VFKFFLKSSPLVKASIFIDTIFYLYIFFGLIIFKVVGIIFNIDMNLLILNFTIVLIFLLLSKLINNLLKKHKKRINITNE